MADREELEALRRLAELEAKSGGAPAASPSAFTETPGGAALMSRGAMGLGKQGDTMGDIRKAREHAAYELGGKATDLTGSPGVGSIVNTAADVATDPLTYIGGAAGKVVAAPAAQDTARWLMQTAIKPQAKYLENGGVRAKAAIETMLQKGINPTEGAMTTVRENVGKLDDRINEILKSSEGRVNTTAVANRLVTELKKAESQALNKDDLAAVRKYWDEFVQTHPENMSVLEAHKLKQGTYAQLGSRPYTAVQPTADVAMKDKVAKTLARGFKEEVSANQPAVAPLLKEQSDLMNVLSVAGRRAMMEGNKNPASFGAFAPSIERLAAWLIDRSAAAKGYGARGLYSIIAPNSEGLGAGTAATLQEILARNRGR